MDDSRLSRLCRSRGMDLGTLATLSECEIDTLRKIAEPQRDPLLTTALRLAESLQVEVEDLFGG
jgi:DNA-binding XRE family transcriptional regulator